MGDLWNTFHIQDEDAIKMQSVWQMAPIGLHTWCIMGYAQIVYFIKKKHHSLLRKLPICVIWVPLSVMKTHQSLY